MKKLHVSIDNDSKVKSLISDKQIIIRISSHHNGVTTEHKDIIVKWDEKKGKVVIS